MKACLCGMRRPSLGQNGGDLSRLTSASSDTESSNNLQSVVVAHVGALQEKNNIDHTTTTTSPKKLLSPTYLTDLLDTTEWLKSSRKRKERQDSTSSTTQDRKLVRSNSEEFISQNYEDYDGLRRVSSHEDFKKRNNSTSSSSSTSTTGSTSSNDDDDGEEDDVPQNDENLMPNSNHAVESHPILNYECTKNKIIGEHVKEKSPNFTQKYRLSPVRDIKNKNDDNTDGADHERQRQNERFSKMRATPGRKAISPRKSSKHSNSIKMMREKDENCYKYDISALKYERRGFVSSKHKIKEHAAQQQLQQQQDTDQKENEPKGEIPLNEDAIDVSDYNDNNLKEAQNKSPHFMVTTKEEELPWSKSFQNDTPIVCPRFADNTYDHVNNSQDKPAKFYTPIILPAKDTKSGSLPIQSKISRDTMKKPASLYLTAEEKIKQINKRLILLKKRYSQYEEKFELSHGHKPSQNDKTSDKIIKNLVSEMSKLRREKHHLKQEPRSYLYSNNNNNNNNTNNNYYKFEDDAISEELREEAKLTKMKETLMEIEKRLQKKRGDDSRSVELETLTPDELIKEKTAVQKGLLYLESLFGRPVTRDERDAARPLYDRYRIIKRLVNRNAMLSGSGISVPELPTILEHEAMAFTCTTTTTSSSNERTSLSAVSMGESDTSDSVQSTTDSTDTSSSMTENVHIMSIQELWTQMDSTREETKTLKKTIKEFEEIFEERNGRKMLKADRKLIEETYGLYKQKKAKLRLLDALIKKQMSTF